VKHTLLFLNALLMVSFAVRAQSPAPAVSPPAGPAHVVTYIEVAPAAQSTVAGLLRRYRDPTRKEPGNVRALALQRIDRRGHFALLETWTDQAAADAHKKAAHTVMLRDALAPQLLAPADERTLKESAPIPGPAGVEIPKGAVVVITHADAIPPPNRGTDLLLPLVDASRRDHGNIRFEILQQPARLNHATVLEVWRTARDAEAHAAAPHTKSFRGKFQEVTGSLYDERLYVVLE